MAICKEADNFLGACDSSGRRYMDSVLLVMNSDEVVPHVPAHVYIEGPVASDSTICRVLGN
eukprot:9170061-Pyramimonas_sp.AAC.1